MLGRGIRRSIGSSSPSDTWAVEYRNADGYITTCVTVGVDNRVYIGLLNGSTTSIGEISSVGLPLDVNTHNLGGTTGTIINALALSSAGVVGAGTLMPTGNTKTESLYCATTTASPDLYYRSISDEPTYNYSCNAIACDPSGVRSYVAGTTSEGTARAFIAREASGVTTNYWTVTTPATANILGASGNYGGTPRIYFGLNFDPAATSVGFLHVYESGGTYTWGVKLYNMDGGASEIIEMVSDPAGTGTGFYAVVSRATKPPIVFRMSGDATLTWQKEVATTTHIPKGMALDSTGRVYVSFYKANVLYITKFTSGGTPESGWSITMSGTTALTVPIHSLAMTSDDRMVVSLTADNTPSDDSTWVFCLPTDGTGLGTYGDITFAAYTPTDGTPTAALLSSYVPGIATGSAASSDADATATGAYQDLSPSTIGI